MSQTGILLHDDPEVAARMILLAEVEDGLFEDLDHVLPPYPIGQLLDLLSPPLCAPFRLEIDKFLVVGLHGLKHGPHG